MTCFLLAAKRLFRSLPFLLSLVLLLTAVPLALSCDRAVSEPTAGFTAAGDGEETAALCASLEALGFVRYGDETALRGAMESGAVSAGAVFPADMEERIHEVNLDGSVLFLCPPVSVLPDLFRVAVVAEILSVASPYFNRPILEELAPGTDLTDEIADRYRAEQATETGFVFEVETVGGTPPTEIDFGSSLALTLLSVFLFVLPLLQACRLTQPGYRALARRMGARTAYCRVFLPEAAVSLLATLLSVTVCIPVAVFISGKTGFLGELLPALGAAVLLALLGLLLPLLFKRADSLQMLIVPVLLLTLILCPVFADAGTFFPAARTLRLFLPTYWIFLL